MALSINIVGETADEVLSTLDKLQQHLTPGMSAHAKARGSRSVQDMLSELNEALSAQNMVARVVMKGQPPHADADAAGPRVETESAPADTPAEQPAKRGRGRPAKAKTEDTAPAAPVPMDDVSEGDEADAGQPDAEDDAADPSPFDDEAKAEDPADLEAKFKAALALYQSIYARAAKGGPAKVKEAQKHFGVGKFIEIPQDRWAEFHRMAVEADAATK